MPEEKLDKSVEDQKSISTSRSPQFALYVLSKHGLNRAKKPIEVYTKQELSQLLKHFYFTSGSRNFSELLAMGIFDRLRLAKL